MALTHGKYYQQSIWLGGNGRPRRYRTQYWGRTYEWLQELHAAERREREEAAREARRLEEEQRAAYRTEAALGKLLDDLLARELGRIGYSRLSRGPWRWRTPMKAVERPEPTSERRMAAAAEIAAAALVARSGDKAALAKLRDLGSEFPDEVIAAVGGDPAGLARTALLAQLWGQPASQDGVELKLSRLTRELEGEDPSPVRRLCAQVAAYAHVEFWLLQTMATKQGWSTPAQLRRLDSALARHLKSARTLAAIARLERIRPRAVHATQVNINVPPAAIPPEPESPALPDF
jgi:hypothetical protein